MADKTTRAMLTVEEIEAMADRLIDDGCTQPTFEDLNKAEKALRTIAGKKKAPFAGEGWITGEHADEAIDAAMK